MKRNLLVLLIVSHVLFFICMFWPLFGMIAYVLLPSSIRSVVAFSILVIGIISGAWSIYSVSGNRHFIMKKRGKALLIIDILGMLLMLAGIAYVFLRS